jgi:hypothetical protein
MYPMASPVSEYLERRPEGEIINVALKMLKDERFDVEGPRKQTCGLDRPAG